METSDLVKQAEALGPWYHEIQLTKDYCTRSYMAGTLAAIWEMTRQKMTDIDYSDKTVLDLGTMDGYWAFRAEQRGASLVVAGDIWQGSGIVNSVWPWNRPGNGIERFLFARQALGSKVVPVVNAEVQCLYARLAPVMRCHAITGFGIIQCLGLLYHIPNPILALRQIRRCLTDRGTMLLETACFTGGGEQPVMRFNRGPTLLYNDLGSYWMPNEVCLREMLALTGFEMSKDVRRVAHSPGLDRICVECRAIEPPLCLGEDFVS